MSVELTVVTLLLKTLRDDPTVPQLKRLNERVQRLAYGFFLDGTSALEDAIEQHDLHERERLVSLALEYFRQGYSRNEAPWASLCAESVAHCYQALGKSQDAQRWMNHAWERWLADRKAAMESIRRDSKESFKETKEGLSPRGWLREGRIVRDLLTAGHRPVIELFDSPWSIAEQWQNLFLLESQARRLLNELPMMGIFPGQVSFHFPADAQRPVYINSRKGDYIGYVSYDGVTHLVHDDSDAHLRTLGIRRRQLPPT
jgi:hypothetical protein